MENRSRQNKNMPDHVRELKEFQNIENNAYAISHAARQKQNRSGRADRGNDLGNIENGDPAQSQVQDQMKNFEFPKPKNVQEQANQRAAPKNRA